MDARYCIDTSSLIYLWRRAVPPDVFPSVWPTLETAISATTVVTPEEVVGELHDDGLARWVKARSGVVLAPDETTMTHVSDVTTTFPNLVIPATRKNVADPWLVATSLAHDLVVVTQEKNPGSPHNPQLPLVCDHYNVSRVDVFDYLRAIGWTH